MSDPAAVRYRVRWERTTYVTAADFIENFPDEWEDAQKRGGDVEAFTVESIKVCDYATLEAIGTCGIDDFDWERA
jgi:hypothetical protein